MKANFLSPWKRLIKLLSLDKRDIKQVFFYTIFAEIVALSVPLGIQAIINLLQSAQYSTSLVVLIIMVTLAVGFQGILQLMQIRILENIQQKIFTRASFEFAYRFPKIRLSELYHYYPPELANRFFDTLTVQKGLAKTILGFPTALLQIVFGLVLLSFYHPFFIFFGAFLILFLYISFRFTLQKGLDTSLYESKQKYKVAHWIQEITRSLISFKIFSKSTIELTKTDKYTTDYLEARENHFKVLVVQFIHMISFKILITLGLLLIGGVLVLNQQMNIGQFVAAEIIILLVISSIEKLITGLESIYDLLTSLEKIGQVVDKKLESEDGQDPFRSHDGFNLEANNLSYVDPTGKKIFEISHLDIQSKDRILVSSVKENTDTFLFKVLACLLSPSSGDFYINNHAVVGINAQTYRSKIGLLLDEQELFEGTILENITFGTEPEEIQDVYEIVNNLGLSPYIKSQPDGINTFLYAGSEHLHPTITKKIILARAIYKQPKILILQKPLEGMKPEDQEKIKNYLVDPKNDFAVVLSSTDKIWDDVLTKKIKVN